MGFEANQQERRRYSPAAFGRVSVAGWASEEGVKRQAGWLGVFFGGRGGSRSRWKKRGLLLKAERRLRVGGRSPFGHIKGLRFASPRFDASTVFLSWQEDVELGDAAMGDENWDTEFTEDVSGEGSRALPVFQPSFQKPVGACGSFEACSVFPIFGSDARCLPQTSFYNEWGGRLKLGPQ